MKTYKVEASGVDTNATGTTEMQASRYTEKVRINK